MRKRVLAPNPATLLASMRAVGYDVATAIADLIDNSISAQAARVDVLYPAGPPDYVAILDNGCGMDEERLARAMRHGSRNPDETRSPTDLGRFGLGLKTASLSQCRRLTVASKCDGIVTAMQWDLDALSAGWEVNVLEPHEIEHLPAISRLAAYKSGTLILWHSLDVLAGGKDDATETFKNRMADVQDHVSLVFHRYLAHPNRLAIFFNGTQLETFDPFLRKYGTILGPQETIQTPEGTISLQAFTLPHISKLSKEAIRAAGGHDSLRKNQGFYVYRQERLVIWGTWFGLARQDELSKLTRVQVDIPNSMDQSWHLDIKKSRAKPPEALRARLRDLIPTLVTPSSRAYRFRGTAQVAGTASPLWQRMRDREAIFYSINMAHPLIQALRKRLTHKDMMALECALRAISESVPLDAIYLDGAHDEPLGSAMAEAELQHHLEATARLIIDALGTDAASRGKLINSLADMEPFASHMALTKSIQERLAGAL